MSVKLVLLKSGETVIADTKELISDDKLCGYLMNNPHSVSIHSNVVLTNDPKSEHDGTIEVSFTPWMPLSSEKNHPIPTDWVVTIAEPLANIVELYEEKINGEDSKVSFTES